MNNTQPVQPVRKRITVAANQSRTFEVFTQHMARWWAKSHSINQSPIEEIVIEPEVGGRWFERGTDGSECQWGSVLLWEPPTRVVLSWQITQAWQFDPSLVTEVDVRFIAEGDNTTVELEHRLDGYGAAAAQMSGIFESAQGWQLLLSDFANQFARSEVIN